MVVQHNMQAANANRMLNVTTSAQSKSTEKLSSGYKINRAADDAAGLSISEKMRKQIKGLDRASTNAQDGVSCVQTAEGALTEVHSMLQRMNELAVQSSNGTLSEDDRNNIQDEVDQLVTEIDRVSETTKFNETYLLKGDENKTKISNTVYSSPQMGLVKDAMAAGSTLEVKTPMDATGKTVYTFTSGLAVGSSWAGKKVIDDSATAGAGDIKLADAKTAELAAMNSVITSYKDEMGVNAVTLKAGDNDVTSTSKTFTYNDSLNISLHVGADSSDDNKISMQIDSMNSDFLGIKGLKVSGKTYLQATGSIDTISDAISKVSKQRSSLGAVQNRLEHTINNLDNVSENTTSAESRIRDTDMAKEMVNYSKNNILAQAGQSMLAQANQSNQGVLSLLQ
ncbi:flagellin [Agathobacter rectalis]|uniref:Flagellin n=1 Tax=Agathobacter rectalis TaxID=39491 RepID=A0A415IK77_9FIRM|nr:flagellin [Agathobacter rectalis]RHL08060.1 flagellin [Agathobacter rectalis]